MHQKLKLEELNRLSKEDFKAIEKFPIVVVLDNIRSMNNVGSVFRSSDCFRVEKIMLCGITATPPHRDIRKTAIGAEETVDWEYFSNTMEAIETLKKSDYQIVSIEQATHSISLTDFNPQGKVALVFGNEVDGVDNTVIKASDAIVEIPQFGTKHSFNIAVSAGIILWEIYGKLNIKN